MPATVLRLRNFFRLLLEAPIEVDFEYVFLSDQDDYWLPNKIISAIQEMQLNKADCYASDLICTYPDGARRFLKKVTRKRRMIICSKGPAPAVLTG